jgi:hypothetical protein
VSGNPNASFKDITLRLSTNDFVVQQRDYKPLLARASFGEVKKVILPSFAAYIVDGTVRGETIVRPSTPGDIVHVSFKMLNYIDTDLNVGTVVTTGCNDKWLRLVLPTPTSAVVATTAEGNASGRSGTSSSSSGNRRFAPPASCDFLGGNNASMFNHFVSSRGQPEHMSSAEEGVMDVVNLQSDANALEQFVLQASRECPTPGSVYIKATTSDEVLNDFLTVAHHEMEENPGLHICSDSDSDGKAPSGSRATKRKSVPDKPAKNPKQKPTKGARMDQLQLAKLLDDTSSDGLSQRECRMHQNRMVYLSTSPSSSSTGAALGTIQLGHITFFEEGDGRLAIKAVCSQHRNCSWIVTVSTQDRTEVIDMVLSWFKRARSLSEEAHAYHSVVIRGSLGVNLRKK